MKKEELIKELISMGGCDAEEEWERGYDSGINNAITLCNQLDEPEVPVIPQFVADYIKVSKEDNESLNQAFAFIDDKENKELWNWMFPTIYEGKRENQESFARAWLDGYTIEKVKMYRVKFPNVTKHGNEMYLEKNDGEDVTSIDWSPKDFVENEDPNDYLFTEQEIKAIDERYWAFAEEVTDNV